MILNFMTALSYSMIATIISSYATTMGAGLTIAGVMAGIFSLAALCIRPLSGMAIDRLNKWDMYLFSTLCLGISFLGYALAPTVGLMLLVRIFHGIAFGIHGIVSMVLVSSYIPKERLSEGLGYFSVGQILAQMGGPYLGITFKAQWGYRSLFLFVFFMVLIAFVILLWTKPKEPNNKKPSLNKKPFEFHFNQFIAKECILYALIGGLFSLGNGITSSFMVLLGEERGITNIGWFFTANALVLLIMRLMLGKTLDRSGFSAIVNVSLIMTAASMFLIGGSKGIMVILLAALLKALGQGGGQLALQSACLKKVDPTRIGIASSTYYIGADLGQGFGPIIGGQISEIFNYQMMFYAIVGLMLLGVIVFNFYEGYKGGGKDVKI